MCIRTSWEKFPEGTPFRLITVGLVSFSFWTGSDFRPAAPASSPALLPAEVFLQACAGSRCVLGIQAVLGEGLVSVDEG